MAVDKKKLKKGPDLDRFLEVGKRRFTTYARGAGSYSLNYSTFVKLVKEAGANLQIQKKVIVDLDILDAYLESNAEKEGAVENV